MKPPPFSYHDPRTVDETVELLARLDNAKLLAGGQSLMPMMNMRYVQPDHVIDLNKISDLAYLKEEEGALHVGAMTRQRTLEFSSIVKDKFPLIHDAILNVGHRQTRNRGTIGGSLCHLDPSAELVTVASAYDATVKVSGVRGERTSPFADFPLAFMTPAIEQDEILVSVRFPEWRRGHGHGFVEFARRHGDFAIASAAALLDEDANGRITRAALTLGGVAAVPKRMREIEKSLIGQRAADELFAEASESCRAIEAIDDVHAPAVYRQHLAVVLARRALSAAHSAMGRS